eukprot:TRINITY_DN35604_c0_g1_i1.p1 TRINITY_DN35604_c0_g1~~TRINITY_DN35604_c0_g1_i1.p1  ORF type:complete len:340 (-),score=59.06 TRINITY_DN35604_c0_g1_i1:347-1366(-)
MGRRVLASLDLALRQLQRASGQLLKGTSPSISALPPVLLVLCCCAVVCYLLATALSVTPFGQQLVGDGAARALQSDVARHPEGYWRILTPKNDTQDLESFIDEVTEALRARPLGRPCLDHALDVLVPQLRSHSSLWLEFGVWTGRSLNMIGKRSHELGRPRKVFGFDSFKGLPENWRESVLGDRFAKKWTQQGSFDLGGYPPQYFVDTKNVDFVVGWFNESLPPFLEKEQDAVSFVHIDSDLYSSAVFVLRMLSPRISPGTVLVFDELINYPGFRAGEMKALHEWLYSQEFHDAGLTGIQVIGYRGPNLLIDETSMEAAIQEQRGEGRKYPQDAVFRVW